MNHKGFLAIALVLFGAIGCSVKEVVEENYEPVTQQGAEKNGFKLVFEAAPFVDGDIDASDTKTYVEPNGDYSSYAFKWSQKDTVGIYPDAGSQVYFTMAEGAGAGTAVFDGGAWSCKEGHEYRSYFPFVGNIYLDATKIPVKFTGQKQVGNANSDHFQKYDYMYTPMVTKGANNLTFSYYHLVTAILPWVELPVGHYTGITLSLDEPLFVTKGRYDLTAASPAIVGTMYSSTLNVELDITFNTPDILKVFIPLAPLDMTGKTLTITVTDENDQTYEFTKNPSKAYVAGSIYRLRSNTSFASQNINFADNAVKAICVENWDTDGDGELSYNEAKAVTSIPQSVFAGNTTITSFDEFQYFTGLTSLSYTEEGDDYFGTFYHCTSLASIVLPPSLQTISVASFRECTALTSITIPASVTRIQALAFLGCTNLDVYMESETPCLLTLDPHGTYDHPYSFGFLANGLVKTIYVPTEACLDTYKSATYWTSYKWRIKWVGEFVPTAPVPEAVDLGLSVKWASFNVGASSPEEYGDYYAWGETKSKEYYTWSNYKYCNGSENSITKYTTVDNKTNLEPEDDVASVKWGRPWRMPTEDEWAELRENCTWTWTDNYNNTGVPGRIVTSNKEGYTNKSIFLPAAGYMASTTMMYLGTYGTYWSSSLQTSISSKALDTYFQTTNYVSHGGSERNSGRSVRPVSAPFNPSILITSIQLNKTETVITGMGNDETLTATVLPSDASYKVLSWTSSNTSVATVNSDGVITAVAAGSATITVSATDGSDVYATCDITVSNIPVPEAVDLGLSVKWASFNVGASAPEEYGDYYAWGEIKPHYASLNPITWKDGMSDGYNWSTYKWYGVYNNQEGKILKYNSSSSGGAVDNKTMLDLEDDVAHITLGGHWRMPTREEFNELMENCTWTWTSINGVNGFLVTSNVTGYTNNSIFFPGAGRMYPKLQDVGNYGWYWSSTGAGSTAWYLYISQYGKNGNTFDRCDGRSVRPVFAE